MTRLNRISLPKVIWGSVFKFLDYTGYHLRVLPAVCKMFRDVVGSKAAWDHNMWIVVRDLTRCANIVRFLPWYEDLICKTNDANDLRLLGCLRNLKQLVVASGSLFDVASVRPLLNCHNLRTLLVKDDITDATSIALLNITSLEQLDVSVRGLSVQATNNLLSAPLSCLCLRHGSIIRANMLRNTSHSIQDLVISGGQYLDPSLLNHCSALRRVQFRFCTLEEKFTEPILNMQLRILHISECNPIREAGLRGISMIKHLTTLSVCLQDLHKQNMTILSKCRKLSVLNLTCHNIADSALSMVTKMKKLRALTLCTPKIATRQLKCLHSTRRNCNMKALRLCGFHELDDDAMEAIGALSSLQSLILNPRYVTMNVELTPLRKLEKLRRLGVGIWNLCDEVVFDLWRFPKLQVLEVHHESSVTAGVVSDVNRKRYDHNHNVVLHLVTNERNFVVEYPPWTLPNL